MLSVDASLLIGELCISMVVGMREFEEVQSTNRSFAKTQRARASFILPSVVEKKWFTILIANVWWENVSISHQKTSNHFFQSY